MNINKTKSFLSLITVFVLCIEAQAFSLLSQKWNTGLNTAQPMYNNLGTPGVHRGL